MQPLYYAIRLWMRYPRLDVYDAAGLDQRAPLGTDELAAVIVDKAWRLLRLGSQSLQRFLHGQRDGLGEHGCVEAPMNQEPAVAIHDVDQIVPLAGQMQVHQVDVPNLVASVGRLRPLECLL